jgi:hypothetical protein
LTGSIFGRKRKRKEREWKQAGGAIVTVSEDEAEYVYYCESYDEEHLFARTSKCQ